MNNKKMSSESDLFTAEQSISCVPKKKRKLAPVVSGSTEQQGPSAKQKKTTKQKVHFNNEVKKEDIQIDPLSDEEADVAPHTGEIEWPQEDLSELLQRIEATLPANDTLSYNTRVDKLDWNAVAFKCYSSEDCKNTWISVQKKIRRFRLLRELLADAKEWITKPWTNFYRSSKTNRHPDMPKRPLSVYMIFYIHKKDKIVAKHPGLDMTEVSKKISKMYRNLSPEKKEKYLQMALKAREEYKQKLEEFYQKHPDAKKNKPQEKKPSANKLKKPLTPFGIFCREQTKSLINPEDINAVKERCKEEWKQMSDKKKVIWINWAAEEEAKYKDELQQYVLQNPNSTVQKFKSVLTKEDILTQERVAGKPTKPPNSAYSLFAKVLLQSEEIKMIDAKDRMNVIAQMWKERSADEKREYKQHVFHLMEQYKLDYASYLESLPEEKRALELQNNVHKRKKKPGVQPKPQSSETQQTLDQRTSNNVKKGKQQLVFPGEPKTPPKSGFELFSESYSGTGTVREAWKSLPKEKRAKYEQKVTKLKKAYIVQLEQFLRSLSKKKLEEFKKMKNNTESSNAESSEDSEEDSNTTLSEEEDDDI